MANYEVRLAGQSVRQAEVYQSTVPGRTPENALHLFIKELRRADKIIPSILRPLKARLDEAKKYEMIDVNDFMIDITNNQRHQYLLKMRRGMFCSVFIYTWAREGSRAGDNPRVIWRVPLQPNTGERDEGMMESQNNIDFLKNNIAIYRSRSERSTYLATAVNKNFINITAAVQALYDFVTGDLMPANSLRV